MFLIFLRQGGSRDGFQHKYILMHAHEIEGKLVLVVGLRLTWNICIWKKKKDMIQTFPINWNRWREMRIQFRYCNTNVTKHFHNFI